MWARRSQPGSPEAVAFAASAPDLASLSNLDKEGEKQIAEIDRVLSQPIFQSANKDFDERVQKRRREVAWYVPLGMPTFGAVTKAVGKSAEYIVFYASLSGIMHSSDYFPHISIGKEKSRSTRSDT